jgi:phosphatidylinositol 4-kinase A
MCDPPLVFAILEVLTLLQRACENEYIDEVKKIQQLDKAMLMMGYL